MANLFKSTEARLLKGLPRTRFGFEKRHTTSFDAGRLIPLLCVETLPGDTWKIDVASLIRMQTPIAPIMDDIYMDYYFFFVPNRVISNALSSNGKGNFERVVAITAGFNQSINQAVISGVGTTGQVVSIMPHSVGNYLGLPIGDYQNLWSKISPHPALGYTMIYNYYFRDENYQTEMPLTNFIAPATSGAYGGEPVANSLILPYLPYKVNNYHNLFTSVLPSPQKGPAITLPLGDKAYLSTNSGSPYVDVAVSVQNAVSGSPSNLEEVYFKPANLGGAPTTNGDLAIAEDNKIAARFLKSDMFVDLSTATAATINQLREAILMQQFLETAARSGTRYKEFIKGFFGVDIGDATIQQPEFIAEYHMNINVAEVVQTSGINSADGTTLGTTGAVSRSAKASNNLLTYSCTEYGYIYCVACVRHKLSYSQGLDPMWTRLKGTDFYNPAWEGIGEVPVKTRQILAPVAYNANFMKSAYSTAGSSVDWDDDLGFNEAFSEYKYFYNTTSGILNPVAKEGLDYWTLTTAFTSATVSGASVRVASKDEINRALSLQTQPQFIGDILFHGSVVRKMRKFSTPGIDRI